MEEIKMFISVESLSEIKGDATSVINGTDEKGKFKRHLDKPYKNLSVTLTYPFNGATFVIEQARSLFDILKPIATFYKEQVYNDPVKNGVWGHGIGDLYFEMITINANNTVGVVIGS